jgi:histidine ammonia-lyase
MVDLCTRVVAIELAVAAQAVGLRGPLRLGTGTAAVYERVREHIPFLRSGEGLPLPLEDLAASVRSGFEVGL